MPNILTLPVGPGMTLKYADVRYKLSDHNRSEISISKERIENRKRMANATMRTFVVATKRKFQTSWEWLPRDDNQTCDGFYGALSLKSFYDNHVGSFELIITYGDSSEETITVMFSDFSMKIRKRGKYTDLYDIDLALEEV